MRQAMHIFLKDSRQFRWPIVVLLVWTAFFGTQDVESFSLFDLGSVTPVTWLQYGSAAWTGLLFPALWSFLLAQILHTEALVGDRHFWLTRPYSRASLLGAKALFVLVYFIAPTGIAQSAIVARSGLDLPALLPLVLWNLVLLTISLVLPAAALGSVTAGLTQFVFALVLVPVVMVSATGVNWGNLDWIRIGALMSLLAAFSCVVLLLQFSRRRVGWARAIGLSGILAVTMIGVLLPWQTAFAVQAQVTGESDVLLTARLAPPDVKTSGEDPSVGSEARFVRLSYVVEGVPNGTPVACEASQVSLLGADGRKWQGALEIGRQVVFSNTPATCPVSARVPVRFLDAVADQAVEIHAELYLTALRREAITDVAERPQRTEVGANDVCTTMLPKSGLSNQARVDCLSAFRSSYPSLSSKSQSWEQTFRQVDYSPFPAMPTFFPVRYEMRFISTRANDVSASVWKPLTHRHVLVDSSAVYLPDYESSIR